MGDRCHLTITFREKDAAELGKILTGSEATKWWDDVDGNPAEGILEVGVDEVNYGWYTELDVAADAGIPFVGWHGAGSEYGEHEFVSCDGKCHNVEVGRTGGFVVMLDADLKMSSDEREYIKAFQDAKAKILKLFG